jgi:hypothetical protein
VNGILTLTNVITGDSFVYQLTGKGEEPLAESHVVIECLARTKVHCTCVMFLCNITDTCSQTTAKFRVPASPMGGGDVEYRVESDLPYINGKTLIYAREGMDTEYQLIVLVPHSCTIAGNITFTSTSSEQYFWYTVEIKTAQSKSEGRLNLSCTVHEVVVVDIPIEARSEEVVLDVAYDGAGLSGDSRIVVSPGKDNVYHLNFAPCMLSSSFLLPLSLSLSLLSFYCRRSGFFFFLPFG